MQEAKILIEQVVTMFILLLLGYLCYKGKLLSSHSTKQLSNLVLTIVSAAFILQTFQTPFDAEMTKELLFSLLISFLILGIGIVLSLPFQKHPTDRFSIIYPNAGYMGIPILIAVFGETGAIFGSSFLICFTILSWTQGVAMLTRHFSFKQLLTVLTSPVILCIFIGIPIFVFQIQLPIPIENAISATANLLTPLSMIVSGAFIAQSKITSAFQSAKGYLICCIRLLIVPLITLITLYFFNLDHTLSTSMLILSSTPCAAGAIQFSARFGGEVNKASGYFTLSTCLCLFTMPLMIVVAEYIL